MAAQRKPQNHSGTKPGRPIEDAERAYKQSLLSFGATGKRLSEIPESLMEAGKAFMKAMKNVAEVEKTPARKALFPHAKTTVETRQSDVGRLHAVFDELIRKDPRTFHLQWMRSHSQRISTKFFRWLSPGDILDVFVAVKEGHSDPNWPGKDYKKVEEVNMELGRRYPQIQILSRPKRNFEGLEEEGEEWFKRAEGEHDNEEPRGTIEEAERAYKQSLLSFGAKGENRVNMPESLMEAGKALMKAMKNAAEGEKTPARIALFHHAEITVKTKQADVCRLRAVFEELLGKDPRTDLQWSRLHTQKISRKFFRWLSPGDILDVFVVVMGRHSDPNWPGKDYKKVKEVTMELGRRYPQIQNLSTKPRPKRKFEEFEEDNEDDVEEEEEVEQEEPKAKKKPQKKGERLSGDKSSENSRDYYRFVTAYLDQAVVRLGKQRRKKRKKKNIKSHY
jgi:hypothetical protein